MLPQACLILFYSRLAQLFLLLFPTGALYLILTNLKYVRSKRLSFSRSHHHGRYELESFHKLLFFIYLFISILSTHLFFHLFSLNICFFIFISLFIFLSISSLFIIINITLLIYLVCLK